jgi:hypothetical protein
MTISFLSQKLLLIGTCVFIICSFVFPFLFALLAGRNIPGVRNCVLRSTYFDKLTGLSNDYLIIYLLVDILYRQYCQQ